MRKLTLILLLLGACLWGRAQDTVVVSLPPVPDTVYLYRTDTVTNTVFRTDTVVRYHTDSIYILRVDTVIQRIADSS